MRSAMERNVVLVRRLYDAFEALDLDAILEIVSPDVVVVQAPELPWGGEFQGHDGLGRFFGLLSEHIRSKVTHEEIFAAGDRVVQVGRTRGTVTATGQPFDIAEMHLLTVNDGKVVRFEAHIDTPAMLEALEQPPLDPG
jgi:ketosteroid isomerase-like protein